jgi:hypothetical protein
MPFFDAPSTNYPKRWSEYSLDFQIFYVWEISLFALIFLSGTGALKMVPAPLFEAVLALWFLVLLGVSIHNRRQKDWRWRGLSRSDWLKTGFGAALMIVFLYVFSQGLLPLKSLTLPMFLFALSIVVFNILTSLRVLQFSEIDFLQSCGDNIVSPVISDVAIVPSEPKWKRAVRGIYSVLFILVWLEGMAFFYVHQKYTHEGSRKPTATQTESVNEHGTLIYLTHEKMRINNALMTMMMVGIPGMIFGGLFLHFVAGVPMFRNMPASRGLFGERSKP